jgi:hypothetical protein
VPAEHHREGACGAVAISAVARAGSGIAHKSLRASGRGGRVRTSLEPSHESQAQPEPKAVLPASANMVLKASELSKSLLISGARGWASWPCYLPATL